MSIGQLSRLSDCRIPTIRYYEQIGLLPLPRRSEGGHRLYGEEALRRLVFIRRSRDLGFSLDAIRSLISLSEEQDRSCAEVDVIASARLAEVQEKLRALARMEDALEDLLEQCRHTTVLECRILEALSPGADMHSPMASGTPTTLHAS